MAKNPSYLTTRSANSLLVYGNQTLLDLTAGVDFASVCNLEAEIYRASKVQDAEGGVTSTWVIDPDLIPCRLEKVNKPADVIIAGAVRTVSVHEFLFPLTDAILDSAIAGQDRIYVGGVGAFEVLNTDLGLSDAICMRAWCVKIGPRDGGDIGGL